MVALPLCVKNQFFVDIKPSYLMIERFVKLESCNKFVLKSFCSQKIKMLDTASYPSHNINDVHAVEGAFDWAHPD